MYTTEIRIIYKGREYFSYKNTRAITNAERKAVIAEGTIGIPEGGEYEIIANTK